MDQAFVVLRNACCDVRFPVNCRLRFLELVEQRARRWNSEDRANCFYSTMATHFPVSSVHFLSNHSPFHAYKTVKVVSNA
jgi:hypothetical protein